MSVLSSKNEVSKAIFPLGDTGTKTEEKKRKEKKEKRKE